MDELFQIEQTKSPRLLWMEKHGISVTPSPENAVDAFTAHHKGVSIGSGATEEWACWSAAKRLKIKLWNEP